MDQKSKCGRMLPNCLIQKTSMQWEEIGMTGRRKQISHGHEMGNRITGGGRGRTGGQEEMHKGG